MKRRKRLLLATVAAATVTAILVGWNGLSSRSKPSAIALPELTSYVRERIDRVAAACSLETVE